MKPTRCAFHQQQIIVNFCRNSQCLLPLCPKCVKIHSIQHERLKTHGIFDQIIQVNQEVEKTLAKALRSLIQYGDSLKNITDGKHSNIAILTQHLHFMRSKILQSVNKCLDGIQTQVIEGFSSVSKSYNSEFYSLDEKIETLSFQVKNQIDGINSEKKMKTLINHLAVNMPIYYENKLNEIKHQIELFDQKSIKTSKDFNLFELQEVFTQIKLIYQRMFGHHIPAGFHPKSKSSLKQSGVSQRTQSFLTRECSSQQSKLRSTDTYIRAYR